MKSFSVFTLGCKVNSYESEAVKLLMLKRGYTHAESHPDIAIVNTCSVTSMSEKKSRQMIRRFSSDNPNVTIAIMGCYSQLDEATIAHLPNVRVVVGTLNRHLIPDLLQRYFTTGTPQYAVEAGPRRFEYEELEVTTYTDRTRAFVKIQDGCDNFCSYCVIPFARGRLRSRNKEEIFKEIGELVAHGFHEIVLTGIHTAGYGSDLGNYHFDDLVADILTRFPGLHRLRISSIEASEITDRFLDILVAEPRLARHLHIPLQSGSDAVLKRMNRHYGVQEFTDKIRAIKQRLPEIAITTDIIVGFPGETETMFLDTYKLAEQLGFSKIHVFPYSPRPGTASSRMDDDVDSAIKKDRVRRLLNLSVHLENAYAARFDGKIIDVIIEQYDEKAQAYEGHASNYLHCHVRGESLLKGQIVTVVYHSDGSPSSLD